MKYWSPDKYNQGEPHDFDYQGTGKIKTHGSQWWHCKNWEPTWATNSTKSIFRRSRATKKWEICGGENSKPCKIVYPQNQGRQKGVTQTTQSVVSSSKSNIARAMRGRLPKMSIFVVLRSQNEATIIEPPSELTIPPPSAPISALQQVALSTSNTTADKRSSGRNWRSPTYYSFDDTSSDSLINAPPKRQRRANDTERFRPSNISVVQNRPQNSQTSLLWWEMYLLRIPGYDTWLIAEAEHRRRCDFHDSLWGGSECKFWLKLASNSKIQHYNLLNITSYDNQSIYCCYILNRGPSINIVNMFLSLKNCPICTFCLNFKGVCDTCVLLGNCYLNLVQ